MGKNFFNNVNKNNYVKTEKYLGKSLEFKHYGLKGKRVEVWFSDYIPEFNNFWIPARVLEEYKKYLWIETRPHQNPSGMAMGEAKPVRIGINKMNLVFGETKIREVK